MDPCKQDVTPVLNSTFNGKEMYFYALELHLQGLKYPEFFASKIMQFLIYLYIYGLV